MSWDTAIVFCALIACNILSSCFQCITGFGDILCLQILWEVCVSFAPDVFHASPLSAEDFHFITILSYVRSLFVQSVLAGLLFYQEQRVNKRRLLEGLKPFISDFNATLLISLTVPALIGAAVGVVTLDYLNEAALRIILGTTSFFFALTFLSLQMMKRLERRQLRDIIRNDLVDMHIAMVLDQQTRQFTAMRKAQQRRRARRRRILRRRRLEYAKLHPNSPSGHGLAALGSAGTTPLIGSPHSGGAHSKFHEEVTDPLAGVGGSAATRFSEKSSHVAASPTSPSSDPMANFSFDDNNSFTDDTAEGNRADLLSLVRRRLAEMSAEASDRPVDESMRETAHYTLQLMQEKDANTMVPGLRRNPSRLSMKQSRDSIHGAQPGSGVSSPSGFMSRTPASSLPASQLTPSRGAADHSTLLAGPSAGVAVQVPTTTAQRRLVTADEEASVGHNSGGDDDDDTASSTTTTTTVSINTSSTAANGDQDPNERLQRILQRAALTGSFAIPSTLLAVRPTTTIDVPVASHARAKKEKHKERVSFATRAATESGASSGGGDSRPAREGAFASGTRSESAAVEATAGAGADGAGAPAFSANDAPLPSTVLVTANSELLAAQQKSQLRGLQHATHKRKPLSAHFVRMDGAVVSAAVASSFASGLLGSYVGAGDAPHVIFGLAMKIGDAVFRKNMPASNIVPGLLRFILGFSYNHYASSLVWYYVASVIAGWVGVVLGLASPVRAENRGYVVSVLMSLLLASFVTVTDSAWKQVGATALVVAIVAYVIVQEHKPPSLLEEELPPPPSTPTTEAEQSAFRRYWDHEEEKMARRHQRKDREFEEGGVDVKRRVRVNLAKPKNAKDVRIVADEPAPSIRETTKAVSKPDPARLAQSPVALTPPPPPRAREDLRRADLSGEDGEVLPV